MENKTQGICLKIFYVWNIQCVNNEVKNWEEPWPVYNERKNCFILCDLNMYLERQTASFIEIVLTVVFTIIVTTYWMPTVRWGVDYIFSWFLPLPEQVGIHICGERICNSYMGRNFGGIWRQASSVNVHALPNYRLTLFPPIVSTLITLTNVYT